MRHLYQFVWFVHFSALLDKGTELAAALTLLILDAVHLFEKFEKVFVDDGECHCSLFDSQSLKPVLDYNKLFRF